MVPLRVHGHIIIIWPDYWGPGPVGPVGLLHYWGARAPPAPSSYSTATPVPTPLRVSSMYEEAETGNPHAEAVRGNPRPIVLQEPYMGEGDYTKWQDHIESVAAVNGWDDEASLAESSADWSCADRPQVTP